MEQAVHKRGWVPDSWLDPAADWKGTEYSSHALIAVIGVGGGAGAMLRHMAGAPLEGVELLVVDTDVAALAASPLRRRLALGRTVTRGLGSGGNPETGARVAEDATKALEPFLNVDLAFVVAGLGGGTGTGAAPVVADLAKQRGVLTVGVVTLPFAIEGSRRRALAQAGLELIRPNVDTLIVIDNDRLMSPAEVRANLVSAFQKADETVSQAVRCITDPLVQCGMINISFADVNAVLKRAGEARLAVGEGEGEDRARLSAEAALVCPLLDLPIDRAGRIFFNVTGGPDTTFYEVNEAAEVICRAVRPDVQMIFCMFDQEAMRGRMRITAVVTGFASWGTAPASASPLLLHGSRRIARSSGP